MPYNNSQQYGDLREYKIDGKRYVVKRHEDWNNDETDIHFTLHEPGHLGGYYDHGEYYGEHPIAWIYDADARDRDSTERFPLEIDVKEALASRNLYTLTPTEKLLVRRRDVESTLKNAKQSLPWAQANAKQRRADVATAVQTAERQALEAEKRVADLLSNIAKLEAERVTLIKELDNPNRPGSAR